MILDVVVLDVSCIDMAVMSGNSVDRGCVGDLGVRIEGSHDGRMVETVAKQFHCKPIFTNERTDLVQSWFKRIVVSLTSSSCVLTRACAPPSK